MYKTTTNHTQDDEHIQKFPSGPVQFLLAVPLPLH